jgi:branched-chain amino acid transport system substrate-binding protein
MNKRITWFFAIAVSLSLILASCAPQGGSTETVKIGLQAPLTGDFAAEGQWAKQSVEIAADLINKKGGRLKLSWWMTLLTRRTAPSPHKKPSHRG